MANRAGVTVVAKSEGPEEGDEEQPVGRVEHAPGMLKDDGAHAMAFLLVVVSIALVVCLGLLIFGRGAPAHHRAPAPGLPAASTATGRSGPDPELEKRRREVDEL
ncbi:MAG: hypothetical protein ACXWLS_05660, partial [Myxococcaceae bacterium]